MDYAEGIFIMSLYMFPVTCCFCQGLADTRPAKHSGEASEPEIPEIPEIPVQNALAKCFIYFCLCCLCCLFLLLYYALHAMLWYVSERRGTEFERKRQITKHVIGSLIVWCFRQRHPVERLLTDHSRREQQQD